MRKYGLFIHLFIRSFVHLFESGSSADSIEIVIALGRSVEFLFVSFVGLKADRATGLKYPVTGEKRDKNR